MIDSKLLFGIPRAWNGETGQVGVDVGDHGKTKAASDGGMSDQTEEVTFEDDSASKK